MSPVCFVDVACIHQVGVVQVVSIGSPCWWDHLSTPWVSRTVEIWTAPLQLPTIEVSGIHLMGHNAWKGGNLCMPASNSWDARSESIIRQIPNWWHVVSMALVAFYRFQRSCACCGATPTSQDPWFDAVQLGHSRLSLDSLDVWSRRHNLHIFVQGPSYKGFCTESALFPETLQPAEFYWICGEFTPRADRSLASIQRMPHNLWESSIDKTAHWFTRRSCACCPFGKERCKDCGVCSSWLRFEKRIHLEPRRLSNSLSSSQETLRNDWVTYLGRCWWDLVGLQDLVHFMVL